MVFHPIYEEIYLLLKGIFVSRLQRPYGYTFVMIWPVLPLPMNTLTRET